MPNPRFTLALEHLEPSQWRLFERLASEFLAVEYPQLRTTASPSGDGGRDGELYFVDTEPTMAFQYSVASDWQAKIRATIRRLKDTYPEVRELVYVTNQTIGALADDLRRELRKESWSLDVRDKSWFEERESTHAQRQLAADELASAVVDPYLRSRGLFESATEITSQQGKIALVHLALEDADENSDRNLTKRCFDVLVLAALDGTDADTRKPLPDIQSEVAALVPAGAPGQVDALVVSALARLSAKHGPVKHVRTTDDYHIAFGEMERLNQQKALYVLEEQAMEAELGSALARSGLMDGLDDEQTQQAIHGLRLVVESALFRLGESFAAAVQSGELFHLDLGELQGEVRDLGLDFPFQMDDAADVVLDVLSNPSAETSRHLRRISDAYTLFAFLKQTPDVQKVVVEIFAAGDVWLDTSAVLPLIGETLLEDTGSRHYTLLLRACVDAGLRLFITEGVIEEVERHLNRCVAYQRSTNWNGRVPFLYSAYILSGRSSADFVKWQDTIRGSMRPMEDVEEYLETEFSISVKSLAEAAEHAPVELRGAVREFWYERHDQRRMQGENGMDPATTARLVDHDVENSVGVIELRKSARKSPMGYQYWWLTLDRTAFRLGSYLKDQLGSDAPASPVLSPEFLSQLFRLGPLRSAVERNLAVKLPVVVDMSRMESVPRELIDLADRVREESAGMDERLIRRHVRDALDSARAKTRDGDIDFAKRIHDDVRTGIKAEVASRSEASSAEPA
jgi:hypothetical protein